VRNPGLIAVVILVLGLGGALWIYVAAALAPGDASGEDPTDSKQYQRQMELYGGKANVLAAELMRWLGSLWHGRRLALTVACATVMVAGGVWLLADPMPANGAARPSRDGR
jgi:hypothetical protein